MSRQANASAVASSASPSTGATRRAKALATRFSSDEPTTVMTSHADPLAAPARRSVRFRTAAGAGCGTMQSVLFIRLVRWIEARGWHLVAG